MSLHNNDILYYIFIILALLGKNERKLAFHLHIIQLSHNVYNL